MNKEKIKISIIVPVYNKERYIGRCIKSLLYQTLKEIEIIVVDDGSTDDSLLIVEKISKQFDNIKIIKQKNSGCSSARNKGIELARGEYIGFVDPDDYVDLQMYEELYDSAIKENFDMVYCGYLSNDGCKHLPNEHYVSANVWSKIFKKEFITRANILFPHYTHCGEDLAFVEKFRALDPSISVLKKTLYYYNENESSVSRDINKRMNIYKSIDDIINFYEINNMKKKLLKDIPQIIIKHGFEEVVKKIKQEDKKIKYCFIATQQLFKYYYLFSIKQLIYIVKIILSIYI